MLDARRSRFRECADERAARSRGSPGRILDDEGLARFLYREEHVAPDGRLAPAAIPTSDLLEPQRECLSVARLQHLTAAGFRQLLADRQEKSTHNIFMGCGVALTADIRDLRSDDGRRELCVVDDAREGFAAHALLQLAHPEGYGRGSVRRLRKRLIDLLDLRSMREFLGTD